MSLFATASFLAHKKLPVAIQTLDRKALLAYHVEGVFGLLQGLGGSDGRGSHNGRRGCLLLQLGDLCCLLLLRDWACCTLTILLKLSHLWPAQQCDQQSTLKSCMR